MQKVAKFEKSSSNLEKTKLDISENIRAKAIGLLSPALASAVDLTRHTKHAHWNIRGPDFIALHKFFDELYSDSIAYVDQIAERITTLGGIAEGRPAAVLKNSSLPEFTAVHDQTENLECLASSFAAFAKQCRQGIDEADEMGDKVTADLFTQITGQLDQRLWFIEGHLR